jgi:hypothetical protein
MVAADGISSSRSATVQVFGANHATLPGYAILDAARGGVIQLRAGTTGIDAKLTITPGAGTTATVSIGAGASDAFEVKAQTTLVPLAGTGTRMVVADASGVLGTQAIPGANLTTVTRTGSASTGATDQYIRQTGSADYTETLPAATGTGRVISLSNRGTGTWTIDASGSETINGELSVDLEQYDSIRIIDAAAGLWEVL